MPLVLPLRCLSKAPPFPGCSSLLSMYLTCTWLPILLKYYFHHITHLLQRPQNPADPYCIAIPPPHAQSPNQVPRHPLKHPVCIMCHTSQQLTLQLVGSLHYYPTNQAHFSSTSCLVLSLCIKPTMTRLHSNPLLNGFQCSLPPGIIF